MAAPETNDNTDSLGSMWQQRRRSSASGTSTERLLAIEQELMNEAHIDPNKVTICHNPPSAILYEDALKYEKGSAITTSGALATCSGHKTGRSPKDKRIVEDPQSVDDIWWGPVNAKMSSRVWTINRERAIDYLNTRNRIYVVDGYAGWDPQYRLSVRVVCARAYHALFMRNMLIRPTPEQLESFNPDFKIYNAGAFPANRYTAGMTSTTSVAINFHVDEMVILGTEYAGEMKKGIFTVMFYKMPVLHNVLTLHSSANEGVEKKDVTLFFGLSGTGKTTLSADPKRALIGDDEHCWSNNGVFNIEGGCYGKTIHLSAEKEPEIYGAIRFGTVLENVVFDADNRNVDYDDDSLTENARAAYPIEYIPGAKIPCIGGHPSNIVLLTCDALGVLPPVSRLDSATLQYHFISGYTSKTPGTEDGITEPTVTFSACFAQPFLALHPMRYAKMLSEKIQQHSVNAWLVNTGWIGGAANGDGQRCPLKYTRAILDAIHSGELQNVPLEKFDVFNLKIPRECPNVPSDILNPARAWSLQTDFEVARIKLATMFKENFDLYRDQCTQEVRDAGPVF